MSSSVPAYGELSDDVLVQLIRQGQSEAFEEIVCRYQQDVANVASALLYHRQETEDIVQQVFVNVFVKLDTFQDGRDFGNWVRAVARNAVREQLRKKTRYDRRLRSYYDMLATRLDDWEDTDDQHWRAEALRRCQEQLSGRAAQVIRLRYNEGRGVSEIATALQVTPNAIGKLLARTRIVLRQCVERAL